MRRIPPVRGILPDRGERYASPARDDLSINRGEIAKQKKKVKSACDATAMLRFFRARHERHYFQHRFCAFRPLNYSLALPIHPLAAHRLVQSVPSSYTIFRICLVSYSCLPKKVSPTRWTSSFCNESLQLNPGSLYRLFIE